MSSTARRRLRLFGISVSVVVFVALAAVYWLWSRWHATLPEIEGQAALPGLTAAVQVERDAQGVPTIRAASRVDASRALGYAHAQDRFFQMDLSRRRAAGELAELFGPAALPLDRGARLHRFRSLAVTAAAALPASDKSVVEAYSTGVNAGLAAFRDGKPWEYHVIREVPRPWRVEDTILCVYAMALDLQEEEGNYERTLMIVREVLGPGALMFFAPLVEPAGGALDGSTATLPPPPGPRLINLRRDRADRGPTTRPTSLARDSADLSDPDFRPGSNAFGLAGRLAGGGALLENDMHLGLAVPNVWYRARLIWRDAESASHDITGVTLPGAPAIVVGSNGSIAWGFTNSYIDAGDLVVVQPDPVRPESLYADGGRVADFETHADSIRVKGQPDETFTYRWTRWGPVVGEVPSSTRPLSHKWTMHDPAAVNLNLMRLETARTAEDAIAIAHQTGIPPQNFLVADRAGSLAWTIAGKIPKRFGHDGRLPITWAYGDRGWSGYLTPAETPVRFASDLPDGAIWSANQRMVGGEDLAKLGNGGYDTGGRSPQIRDHLIELARRAQTKPATPRDLLDIALDDRSLFLERWRQRLLATLTPEVVGQNPQRAAARKHLENWEGRASVSSVGYRLVRTWRHRVATRALEPIFAPCVEAWSGFSFRMLPYEHPLWALLEQRPTHLLDPSYADWDALLLAAFDDVITGLDQEGLSIDQATWGRQNTLRMRHPFSSVLPSWIRSWVEIGRAHV